MSTSASLRKPYILYFPTPGDYTPIESFTPVDANEIQLVRGRIYKVTLGQDATRWAKGHEKQSDEEKWLRRSARLVTKHFSSLSGRCRVQVLHIWMLGNGPASAASQLAQHRRIKWGRIVKEQVSIDEIECIHIF